MAVCHSQATSDTSGAHPLGGGCAQAVVLREAPPLPILSFPEHTRAYMKMLFT